MNNSVIATINYQVVLDAIGLIQGATLGLLLIVLNRRNFRSSFFLGLFLLFFSLELALFISIDPVISQIYPGLYLLPFHFSWLLFPLFFLYTQQVSIHSDDTPKYWLLYPGIASLLLQLIIFSLPYEAKQEIFISKWYGLIVWKLGYFYSWIIGLWNLRLLSRHRIEVQNTYSHITSKELRWARILLIYLLTSSLINFVLSWGYISIPNHTVFLAALDVLAVYWIAYFGIVQRNVHSLSSNEWDGNISQKKTPAKASSNTPEDFTEELQLLMEQIDTYMISSEIFVNPNLTISDLASGLNMHPKRISRTINLVRNQNFNSYVNDYRIKKAKALLEKNKSADFSIEGIGKEVGFHSKSAFYSAFRKITNTTPSRFIGTQANY